MSEVRSSDTEKNVTNQEGITDWHNYLHVESSSPNLVTPVWAAATEIWTWHGSEEKKKQDMQRRSSLSYRSMGGTTLSSGRFQQQNWEQWLLLVGVPA